VLGERIQSIVIVGAGAAGCLAAATLARLLEPGFCDVRLVDSPRQCAGPPSQATPPSFHRLNRLLGIDEQDLMRRTAATFRLGTQFVDWGRLGDAYFHPFGPLGARLDAVPFHHHWLKLRQLGADSPLEDYSTAAGLARQGRFAHPLQDRTSVLSLHSYGYHFDSELLASYLREYAQAHGTVRLAREVIDVRLRAEDGFIDDLLLDDGSCIKADLYVDCSGALGALAGQSVESGFVDWSDWLPCDRAVCVSSVPTADLPPNSQATAVPCGWQWRVPLQQGFDEGYAYSNRFVSDDQAAATLLGNLSGAARSEPRFLRLLCGRPAKFWDKNCLTLMGHAIEPLESTGLHLVQTGISRLLALFPVRRFSPCEVEEYNRLTVMEFDRIRDFLILHYKATTRQDSPFWDQCRQMNIPHTLAAKIELFRCCGRIGMLEEEHFSEDSWLSVLLGQGIDPQDYDPLADALDIDQVRSALTRMRSMIQAAVTTQPRHGQYIDRYCHAEPHNRHREHS
jgi:tryptophan 7-halogenase